MSNEQYLIVSYFTIGFAAILLAGITYLALRTSFASLMGALPVRNFSRMLRRLFFPGLVLPALIGFFSVSFRGCGKSYNEIIASRSNLIVKNQEQLSATLEHIAYALLFWGIAVLVYLLFLRGRQPSGTD